MVAQGNRFGELQFEDGDALAEGSAVGMSEQEELTRAAGLRPLPRERQVTEYVPPATTTTTLPLKPLALAAGGAVALLAVYILVSSIIGWLGMKADDLQYGRPRTYQLDAYVGHSESEGHPTHFIALNLDHQVDVIELPGGDVSKARAISGPYLFGSSEDLTPVTLEVRDVNGDAKPDLLVDIKQEQVVYINSGSDFHLMTPSERAVVTGAAK